MADFAPNYTPRYVVKYRTAGGQHSQLWRVARGVSISDAGGIASKLTAYLGALSSVLYEDFTVLGASFCAEDSDVFLPCEAPTATGTFGAVEAVSAKAKALSFVGRTLAGAKHRVFQYGIGFTPDAFAGKDFRILGSESVPVANAISELSESAPGFVGNDNVLVSWYNYANLKYNDYWVGRVRQGS